MSKTYDFDFICRSLNLIPYYGGAFNPLFVEVIKRNLKDDVIDIAMSCNEVIRLNSEDMAKIEQLIRERMEQSRHERKQAFKEQVQDQTEVMQELNSGVLPGGIVPGAGLLRGKRGS